MKQVDLSALKDLQESTPEEGKRLVARLRILRIKFKKVCQNHRFLLLSVSLIAAVFISAASIYFFILATIPKKASIDTSYKLLEAQNFNRVELSTMIPVPPEIKDQQNPINGELYTKTESAQFENRKALAVMIENTPQARPQAGLQAADIVYEALAESGITRYLAIFWAQDAPKIGPIRSVRTYYLDLLSEYDDPPLVNIGQAGYESWEDVIVPEADARAYMNKYNIKSFDRYGRGVTWRDLDKFHSGIAWEHVAYSSTAKAWEEATKLGWVGKPNITSLTFKQDTPKENRPLSQELEIQFLSLSADTYKVKWVYDPARNLYNRFLAGTAHIDENTGQQLTAKNIIVEYCQYHPAGDKNGRLVITTIGNGKAQILMDGRQIDAVWEKSSRTDRTQFFDSDGNPISFDRGKIWVEVVLMSGTNAVSKVTIN